MLIVAAAGAASLVVQRRSASSSQTLAWLLLIWFVAAPYSRPYDLALLTVPATVLGPLLPIVALDCWLATALRFYGLSSAAIVAPLLLLPAPHATDIWRRISHRVTATTRLLPAHRRLDDRMLYPGQSLHR